MGISGVGESVERIDGIGCRPIRHRIDGGEIGRRENRFPVRAGSGRHGIRE